MRNYLDAHNAIVALPIFGYIMDRLKTNKRVIYLKKDI